MNVKFQKHVTNYELATFEEYEIIEDIEFCCYRLRIMDSQLHLWNKKSGKFCWADTVSHDDVVSIQLTFVLFVVSDLSIQKLKTKYKTDSLVECYFMHSSR
jgi:hypothetical protein